MAKAIQGLAKATQGLAKAIQGLAKAIQGLAKAVQGFAKVQGFAVRAWRRASFYFLSIMDAVKIVLNQNAKLVGLI